MSGASIVKAAVAGVDAATASAAVDQAVAQGAEAAGLVEGGELAQAGLDAAKVEQLAQSGAEVAGAGAPLAQDVFDGRQAVAAVAPPVAQPSLLAQLRNPGQLVSGFVEGAKQFARHPIVQSRAMIVAHPLQAVAAAGMSGYGLNDLVAGKKLVDPGVAPSQGGDVPPPFGAPGGDPNAPAPQVDPSQLAAAAGAPGVDPSQLATMSQGQWGSGSLVVPSQIDPTAASQLLAQANGGGAPSLGQPMMVPASQAGALGIPMSGTAPLALQSNAGPIALPNGLVAVPVDATGALARSFSPMATLPVSVGSLPVLSGGLPVSGAPTVALGGGLAPSATFPAGLVTPTGVSGG